MLIIIAKNTSRAKRKRTRAQPLDLRQMMKAAKMSATSVMHR